MGFNVSYQFTCYWYLPLSVPAESYAKKPPKVALEKCKSCAEKLRYPPKVALLPKSCTKIA